MPGVTQPVWAEYTVKQKITPMANIYSVASPQGPVGFVRQKRLKLREEIIFFTDESQQRVAFRIKARKIIDLGSRYDVLDEAGGRIGVFGKAFGASLTRSTWVVFDPAETGELLRVQERSQGIAAFRRIWGFLPYINDLPFPLKYHFDILGAGHVIGVYDKITTFRDHYRLTLNEPPPVDSRVILALAIALDALQSR
ncbi:MAG: hypothetical protein V7637_879 [Mycobacteriales bacterium]